MVVVNDYTEILQKAKCYLANKTIELINIENLEAECFNSNVLDNTKDEIKKAKKLITLISLNCSQLDCDILQLYSTTLDNILYGCESCNKLEKCQIQKILGCDFDITVTEEDKHICTQPYITLSDGC